MAILKGDFIGFTYDETHSSEMGIIRTSNGDRYQEDLLPNIEHKKVSIPGSDGSYDFGTYYRDKSFSISIAFDSLSELQYERLRMIFGDRKVHRLIFDEKPYKVYLVKIEQKPNFQTICFDYNGERVYKGEADLNFITSGSPFARSRYKYKEDYTSNNIAEWTTTYGNRSEWLAASRIESQGNRDKFDSVAKTISVFNAGQLPTDFKLRLKFSVNGIIPTGNMSIEGREGVDTLHWKEMQRQDDDWGVEIDTRLNLMRGVRVVGEARDIITTGNIYNHYKEKGNFFKIPENKIFDGNEMKIIFNGIASTNAPSPTDGIPFIVYDYLYY